MKLVRDIDKLDDKIKKIMSKLTEKSLVTVFIIFNTIAV